MAHTTVDKVSALMQKTFDSTTSPTDTQVTNDLIPWSDRTVDIEDLSGAGSLDKEFLSSLLIAHVISTGQQIDFKTEGLAIKPTQQPSVYLALYQKIIALRKSSLVNIVND
ncbi:MAG TPA: hypothetical protein ENH95_06850 [Nitrosopumilus sp.]|nr:hypothetical protein [Nitrosopumilus sp.]